MTQAWWLKVKSWSFEILWERIVSGWSVAPIGGWWWTLVVAGVLAAVLLVGPSRMSRRQRTVLVTLRGLTALLLLLAMLRPSWVTSHTRRLPGSLVLLLDSSRSMQISDSRGDDTRWNALGSLLDTVAEQLAQLAETWDLKLYLFDETIRPVRMEDGRPQLPDQPPGAQTAVGFCLENVLEQESRQRLVAVLLLSDGAQRAFPPRDVQPQTIVRRMAVDNIPLYTLAFGKPALGLQSDLRVEDVLVNDVVFADTPVTVQATIAADGYANQNYKVQLLWENPDGALEVVATHQLQVDQQPRQTIPLTYTPRLPGEYKVTVQIESPAGELVQSNNRHSTFVTVQKGGVQVLYLAGASRIGGQAGIEPRFLRAALAAHPDFHVRYELLNYRKPQLDLRNLLEEGKFDVFLLGNVDVNALNQPTWKWLAQRVERSAGLAMLGGFHSFGPGGFRNSPLAPVLPVGMGRAERQNFGEPPRADMHLPGPLKFLPRPLGNQLHPMVQIQDQQQQPVDWSALPELDGANRLERTQVKPNALTIATDAAGWPLLVAGAWGDGRTLALAIDSTWHWQLEGFGDVHRRFWRQLVLWLARKDATEGAAVWVRLDGRRYQRGSRVQFSWGARDAAGQPQPTAPLEVAVELPDGSLLPVPGSRRGDHWSAGFTDTKLPGDYRVTVRAAAETAGSAQARFTVPDVDLELDQPAAEPTFLASLADLTAAAGGAGLAPEELPELLRQLEARTSEFEERVEHKQTLWDTWPMLLTLVGLLGSEWYLRKRWGLV